MRAVENGAVYIEVSALTGSNIKDLFRTVAFSLPLEDSTSKLLPEAADYHRKVFFLSIVIDVRLGSASEQYGDSEKSGRFCFC